MNPLLLGAGAAGLGYIGKKAYDTISSASDYDKYIGQGRAVAGSGANAAQRLEVYDKLLSGIENDLYDGNMDNDGHANIIHTLKSMGATQEEIGNIINGRLMRKQQPMFEKGR